MATVQLLDGNEVPFIATHELHQREIVSLGNPYRQMRELTASQLLQPILVVLRKLHDSCGRERNLESGFLSGDPDRSLEAGGDSRQSIDITRRPRDSIVECGRGSSDDDDLLRTIQGGVDGAKESQKVTGLIRWMGHPRTSHG